MYHAEHGDRLFVVKNFLDCLIPMTKKERKKEQQENTGSKDKYIL